MGLRFLSSGPVKPPPTTPAAATNATNKSSTTASPPEQTQVKATPATNALKKDGPSLAEMEAKKATEARKAAEAQQKRAEDAKLAAIAQEKKAIDAKKAAEIESIKAKETAKKAVAEIQAKQKAEEQAAKKKVWSSIKLLNRLKIIKYFSLLNCFIFYHETGWRKASGWSQEASARAGR